ncbi:MAG: HD domain-containing phosphohydrolase [Candidatus Humimicrobiaceae bacterium]
MHKIHLNIKTTVMIIVAISILPLAAMIFYTNIMMKNEVTKYFDNNFMLTTQIIADSQEAVLENTEQILAVISQDPDVKNSELIGAQKLFQSLVKQFPYYLNLGLIGLDGYVKINAENKPAYYGDETWFQDTIKNKDFTIGEYQIGRSTKKIQINYGYPVLDGNNKISGVIYAAIDLSYLSKSFIKNYSMPDEIMMLLDGSGNIIARYPDPESWIGKNISDTPLFDKIKLSKQGNFELNYEGKIYLFKYIYLENLTKLKNNECLVVGIPKQILLGDLNKNLIINIISFLAAIIISILLVILFSKNMLLKPISRLITFSRSIASGNFNARSGFLNYESELGKLAKSLDETAGLLGKSHHELSNSEIKFKSFTNNTPALTYIKDSEGKFIFVNKAYLNFIKGKEWKNKTDYDFWPEDAANLFHKSDLLVLSGNSPIIEEPIINAQGEVEYWQIYKFLLFDSDNNRLLGGINFNITDLRKSQEEIKRHLERLTAMYGINKMITSSTDLNFTLEVLAKSISEQLRMDACYISLLNNITTSLEINSSYGFKKADVYKIRIDLDKSIAGKVVLENKSVYVKNLKKYTGSINTKITEKEDFFSLYALPLTSKGKVLGVLELFKREVFNPDKEWIDYLNALAENTSIAVENAKAYQDVQSKNFELILAYDETLEGWSKALDLRDKETEGHTLRVTEMAVKLGMKFNLNEKELVDIRRGALLHDIGKMGIPDSILLKPESLSEEEWKIMRTHPQLAYRLLSPIKYIKDSLDIPHYHHEKWDGSGYPYGFKGEEIPIAARIFSIIDVWDAITSDRPYRKRWTAKKALGYIKNRSGKDFDPGVVSKFLELLNMS